jgi:Ca2+-binding RTX toxin-like protein
MRILPILVTAAAVVGLPAGASAATVSSDRALVTYRSGPASSDMALIRGLTSPFGFLEAGETLVPGANCVAGPPVSCEGFDLEVRLGGGDDRSKAFGSFDEIAYGADGNDEIYSGGNHNDAYGGAGDDLVIANSNGSGTAYGNLGNDTLYGMAIEPTVVGGGGDDFAVTERAMASEIVGGEGFDRLFAFVSRETAGGRIAGGEGYDLLAVLNGGTATTSSGGLTLEGGPGDDTILGGPGADVVSGGGANDAIDVSGDGAVDTVECAGGYDIVWADPQDTVARNCEGRREGPMPHSSDVDEALAEALTLKDNVHSVDTTPPGPMFG